MFRTLRRIFSRIRFVLNAIRSAIYGIALVAAIWIVALPASETEIARFNLPQTASADAEGLRHYRMTKLLLLVGTDRTFDMIAKQSGAAMSGDELQLALQIAVSGNPAQTQPSVQSGAKFIPARTD
ncbi:hypothetical protein FHS72_000605 [Loktanella ponticola]|uniref:Uncharacterized protein n=1 Tax=Yoonia ponticola TaxID=1524255 RepID=A0A7W9EWV4_9RHOB|nr:hypothetical protein [Yoonia ponticola]MBB5720998.1 hypothetical protein [Yoonia ponticola]